MARLAELVAEIDHFTAESKRWGGHHNGFTARAQMTAIQARLSAEKPLLAALKQARHAESWRDRHAHRQTKH